MEEDEVEPLLHVNITYHDSHFLSQELLLHVVSFIPAKDLHMVSLLSKDFYDVCEHFKRMRMLPTSTLEGISFNSYEQKKNYINSVWRDFSRRKSLIRLQSNIVTAVDIYYDSFQFILFMIIMTFAGVFILLQALNLTKWSYVCVWIMYVAMCMKEGYDAILNSVRGVKYARAIISFVVPLTVPLLVITLAQQASSISWFVIPFITATYFREYKITTTLGLLASLLLVASYNDGYISSLFVALIPLYAIQIKYIVGQYSSEPYVGTSSKLNGILILISQLVFGILHPLPISWLS